MTAKLIASEIINGARTTMKKTPESWLNGIEEIEHALRYAQILRYLQTNYKQAATELPRSLADTEGGERILKLLDKVHDLHAAAIEVVENLLMDKKEEEELFSVPKFYYSELRNRRKCTLPEPPLRFTEKSLLDYLVTDAVAYLRNIERFALLEADGREVVPVEAWVELRVDAQKAASEVVAGAILVFGEDRVSSSLKECVKEELGVIEDMARQGSTTASGLDEDSEDEDDGEYCEVRKPIFVVSDCTGESAERTVRCALGQFGHCFERTCPADIKTFRFCNAAMIPEIVREARELGAFIVYTLVDPVTNAKMIASSKEHEVQTHDLWTPLFQKLEGVLDATPLGVPSLSSQIVDEKYMQLIDCIEYTQTLDDGVNPRRWQEADLMIIGPSRSGKTPLAFFMAQRGFKVANYPLVPDETIPEELYKLQQDRVFALTTEPKKLVSIRTQRMKTLRMGSQSAYANIVKVQSEVEWCRQLYKKNPGWNIIDTTDTGIEEACGIILKILAEQGTYSGGGNMVNPSAI